LLNREYLQEVQKSQNHVHIGDVDARDEKRYRLARRRIAEMGGVGRVFEEEAYVIGPVVMDNTSNQVGHYKLFEEIGSGGMSTVYRAWDEQNNNLVAVKFLRSNLNADLIERFKQEAQLLNTFRHPNIVRYYNWGEQDGLPYIAMEYIDGPTLQDVLRTQERLSYVESFSIAILVAEAIHYVHRHGIVRLDVKPSNIMFNRHGKVYIVDFSIAKRLETASGDNLTQDGVMIGTPAYMSPEHLLGERLDARIDIYSLGVVMYEMVTGRLPHKEFFLHLSEIPEPPSHHVNLPPEVDAITMKCLEKDPKNRFQTMAELAEAMYVVMASRPSPNLSSLVMSSLEKARLKEEKERKGTEPSIPARFRAPLTEDRVLAQTRLEEKLSPGAYLGILRGPNISGKNFALQNPKTDIGRDNENHIVLDDSTVSRFHSRVTAQDDTYYISDLNSATGTLVNGSSISDLHKLEDRDRIQIGAFILEFRLLTSLGLHDDYATH
jgi:serine/threonine-protein kinase